MIREMPHRYGPHPIYVPDTDNGQYAWLLTTQASPEDEWIDLVLALMALRPRGVALDVGANFGCWTVALSTEAYQVHAFEPQRQVCGLLRRTVRPLGNVFVYQKAIGEHSGLARIPDLDVINRTNFGGVSMNMAHWEHPDAPMQMVAVATIDSFDFQDVSFIKVDVEGEEAAALEGARDTIKRCKPILFIEALFKGTDDLPDEAKHERAIKRARKLQDTIEAMGYAVDHRGPNYLCLPLVGDKCLPTSTPWWNRPAPPLRATK
jgi:FkbM family methyltransferase